MKQQIVYGGELMNFNEKQLETISATEDNVVVIAPPGSGKTTTMVGAIQKYISENPKNSISAITFTRAATGELNEKINTFFSNIHISTIHSWSKTQLERLAEEKGFRVRVMQEKQIKIILQNLIKKVNPRLYPDTIFYYVMGNRKMDIGEGLKKQFNQVLELYLDFKLANTLYDFTDYPVYLYKKLVEYDKWIDEFDALFVDEFQDVDPVQLQVFQRVVAAKKFYIGDPDQAIYIFRGASEEVFNEIPEFKVYTLDTNYRSYQEIIDYATTAKIQMLEKIDFGDHSLIDFDDAWGSPIKSSRGDGGTVCIVKTGRGEPTYHGMPIFGTRGKEVGGNVMGTYPRILCRKNKEVKAILELGYGNVDTIHSAKGLEFENVIVTDFKMKDIESINVAYVGITRAKDTVTVAPIEVILKWVGSYMLEYNKPKANLF